MIEVSISSIADFSNPPKERKKEERMNEGKKIVNNNAVCSLNIVKYPAKYKRALISFEIN